MKLENFCKVKDTVNRTKWKSTKWEKIFSSSTYDRGANIQNTYKELKHRLQQTKQFNYKSWYRSKQRILIREIFNERQTKKFEYFKTSGKCKSKPF